MNSKYLKQYEKVVGRLQDVLEEPKNDFIRDSAIKRFEICYEIAWKLIKRFLKKEGIDCVSPRSCFREAYRQKLIKCDNKWLDMIEYRSLTSHIYNEETAEEIYEKLDGYLKLYKELSCRIKDRT